MADPHWGPVEKDPGKASARPQDDAHSSPDSPAHAVDEAELRRRENEAWLRGEDVPHRSTAQPPAGSGAAAAGGTPAPGPRRGATTPPEAAIATRQVRPVAGGSGGSAANGGSGGDDGSGGGDDDGTTGRRGKPKKPRTRGQKVARGIGLSFLGLFLIGLLGGIGIIVYGYASTNVPKPNAAFNSVTTFVYYNDGKTKLGSFAIQNRQPLTFDKMPENMKQAVVAAENRTFWTDKGVSFTGMARAAWNIARGGSLQGGSTITQQYIKIYYLNSQQTASRKFREVFLAYKLNKQLTKEQILAGYLNTIYFGHGAYGVQAAARAYFNVDAKDLTVPQAAVLTAVFNNPTLFDPSDDDNIPRLTERYRYVLQSMSETGAITPLEASKYAEKLPKFPKVRVNDTYGGTKGFLLKMVQNELAKEGFAASRVQGGGLKIVTTFDKDSQEAAVAAAEEVTKRAAEASGQNAKNLHAALASVDVGSGEVVALYGNPDYVKNSRNWATTARPTASTFKAYTLAAGLKDGYSLLSTFHGSSFYLPGDTTIVRNEYSQNYGSAVNLLRATTDSINTAFVDLITSMDGGKDKVLSMAEAAGLPKTRGWDAAERNIPIGTPEVSPLNQANGYATFANDGTYVQAHVVREVRDAKNKVIYKANPTERRAVSADIAHDVTYALSNVVENGTGRSVQTLNRPVAGKTGTNGVTVDDKDIVNSSWFVGYTKQISTAVMFVAGDAGTSSLDEFRRPGDSTFFGGTYPAQTWAAYMAVATDGQPVKSFDPPAYVNRDKAQPTNPVTQQPTPTLTQTPSQTPTSSPTQPTQTPAQTPTATRSQPSTEPSGTPTRTAKPRGKPSGNP